MDNDTGGLRDEVVLQCDEIQPLLLKLLSNLLVSIIYQNFIRQSLLFISASKLKYHIPSFHRKEYYKYSSSNEIITNQEVSL